MAAWPLVMRAVSIRLLRRWNGWTPREMNEVDEHLMRYEHAQAISITYDVELADSDDNWRSCAVSGIDSEQEAGRLLDELYIQNPYMVDIERSRVVKVVRTLAFEHREITNASLRRAAPQGRH